MQTDVIVASSENKTAHRRSFKTQKHAMTMEEYLQVSLLTRVSFRASSVVSRPKNKHKDVK